MQDLGYSRAIYGALLSLEGILIVCFELPLVLLTRRLPARPLIAAGLMLIGIGFSLNALGGSLPILVVSVLVWTLGEMSSAPIASAYVADIASPGLQGRYQGAAWSARSIGFVAGPALGTLVYALSPNLVWAGCLILGLASAGLAAAGPPNGHNQEPRSAIAMAAIEQASDSEKST